MSRSGEMGVTMVSFSRSKRKFRATACLQACPDTNRSCSAGSQVPVRDTSRNPGCDDLFQRPRTSWFATESMEEKYFYDKNI